MVPPFDTDGAPFFEYKVRVEGDVVSRGDPDLQNISVTVLDGWHSQSGKYTGGGRLLDRWPYYPAEHLWTKISVPMQCAQCDNECLAGREPHHGQ